MPGLSRRRFLATGAAAAGALAVGVRPAAASAAKPRTTYGDIRDIQHVIVLMQENRSFDHYFGTLRGVRGFGDRSTVILPGGYSVFQQPASPPGEPVAQTQYPWPLNEAPTSAYPPDNQPPSSSAGAQNSQGLAHGWDDQHIAWQNGVMNGWLTAKEQARTLGYLTRADIPYHFALADTYTVGDAYHSSALSSTGPNRTYLWSGTIDAQHKFSRFTAYNGGDERGRDLLWETYAETLEAAGVSWRVYQCIDHFDNNGLEYFKNFAVYDPTQAGTPAPGNPLYDKGIERVSQPYTGVSANPDNIAAAIANDIAAGTLPQVSWIVPNRSFCEHPGSAPNNGAYLINAILQALSSDPDVFNSTLVILNYDENDGWFDHVPPPVAPPGTTDEWYREHPHAGSVGAVPIGLGFRVPLILISPWSRGGWVTSEVFDHTSIIQFLERWTGALGKPATCTNISAWRRQVCGDLTHALDFSSPVYGLPDLPPTAATEDPASGSYQPMPVSNAMPVQDPGSRPARPLPYQPNANLDAITLHGDATVRANVSFSNSGVNVARACHFAVYNNAGTTPPHQYTVAAHHSTGVHVTNAVINLGTMPDSGEYDITVLGPNRFLRRYTGSVVRGDTTSQVRAAVTTDNRPVLTFHLVNNRATPVTFTVRQRYYSTGSDKVRVSPRSEGRYVLNPMGPSNGWYDVTVTVSGDGSWSRRYVGHLETGRPSVTGS